TFRLRVRPTPEPAGQISAPIQTCRSRGKPSNARTAACRPMRCAAPSPRACST
ncbi:hypothetical protein BAE44_0009922, partial [Dichanthelium oligosanthes]